MNKDKIIEEIQRTAEANGGTPLGRKKFFQETGIKESDWSGKFWIRWSDAIVEAGLIPNKMQKAFADKYLFEKYVQLVKEIGHIPTAPEIRMKRRNDPNFPSRNTFSRLGTKQQLLSKLLAFCRANIEYEELIPIFENECQIDPKTESNEAIANSVQGYVYLIKFGNEYKIGNSNNVERRFREIRTQMPYSGKIIHTIATGDPEGIEAYWHQYFKEKRLKGEWFNLSNHDVKYFKKRKLM